MHWLHLNFHFTADVKLLVLCVSSIKRVKFIECGVLITQRFISTSVQYTTAIHIHYCELITLILKRKHVLITAFKKQHEQIGRMRGSMTLILNILTMTRAIEYLHLDMIQYLSPRLNARGFHYLVAWAANRLSIGTTAVLTSYWFNYSLSREVGTWTPVKNCYSDISLHCNQG